MADVTYETGIRDEDRERAAEVYYAAFRRKLGPILGDRGTALIAETFRPERAIVARRDGRVVGIVGLQYGGIAFVGVKPADLRRHYGAIGGTARLLVLAMFESAPEEGELLLDGLAVAEDARGGGIGSELLRRVCSFAANEGFSRVRLDVVDTNPGARRLYERYGFEATKTEDVPWLRNWFGFGASTTMVKAVGAARIGGDE